jgi:ferredoxin
MRTRIFYFSSTGNSLHAARLLARAMDAPPPSTMVGAAFSGDADAVGLVFPVYLHKTPAIALEFVRRSSFGPAYVFAVATDNGEPGSCMKGLDAALRSRGSRLAAGFGLLMPGNSVIIADLTNPTDERARRLAAADASIGDIAARALAREENRGFRREGAFSWAKSRLFGAAAGLYRLPSRFTCGAACSGCGTCERVCPRANVVLALGRPSWGRDCESCLACYHACPARAVDIEEYTKDRLRYRHPEVGLEELCYR